MIRLLYVVYKYLSSYIIHRLKTTTIASTITWRSEMGTQPTAL